MIMHNDVNLAALRAFRAVARQGSFAAAALTLRVPKSTVSKRISDLEGDLGLRLIERTTRHLHLTAEGSVLLARADRLLDEADDLRRLMSDTGSAPRGHLRIAVPSVIGHLLMGRIGVQFRNRYPDITLDCALLDRSPDLREEGFDGAVRICQHGETVEFGHQIGRARAILAAAPDLPGLNAVTHPRDLANISVIGSSPGWPGPLAFTDAAGTEVTVTITPQLSIGSTLAMRDAALAGGGVALLPWFMAQPEITAGRLVQVLPDWHGREKSVYFVYPSADAVTTRLRAFIEVLVEQMSDADGCLDAAAFRP